MPKGPRTFHFSFEKTLLTRFGGLSLFHSFCKSLDLWHLFGPGAVRPIVEAKVADLNQFARHLVAFPSAKHES